MLISCPFWYFPAVMKKNWALEICEKKIEPEMMKNK